MNKLAQIVAALKSARTKFAVVATGAAAATGAAGAQAVTPSYQLDLSAPITGFGGAMTGTITDNSPELFGILALSVGFFFLWGRVRALF